MNLKSALLCLLLLGALAPGTARAHPHVLPSVQATIVFDAQQRVGGIRQTWIYDLAYSNFIARENGPLLGGPLSAADLKAIADKQTEALAQYGFFTKARASGRDLPLGPVRDVAVIQGPGGQIELSFLLPVQNPVDAEQLEVEVHDPNYFAYFTIAADGVALQNARPQCKADSTGPKPIDLKQTKLIPAAFWEALDGSAAASVQFVNRITVTCR